MFQDLERYTKIANLGDFVHPFSGHSLDTLLLSPHTYILHPTVQQENAHFLLLKRASSLRGQSPATGVHVEPLWAKQGSRERMGRISVCVGLLCTHQVSSKESIIGVRHGRSSSGLQAKLPQASLSGRAGLRPHTKGFQLWLWVLREPGLRVGSL